MAKEYEIKTFQDIVDCTNENNLDNFLIDLKKCLLVAYKIRKMDKNFKFKEVTWTDDSQHNIELIIK